ncbi:hypothetical protein Y032_0333g2795 [Ancylostoma ceylanicum]|uniref:Uncharacterized protein n=1 Tax=Ancylostoma ceylanicum TaxID=53326 RepID=A0A016RYW2_9BILA|nr:hypothetical protein Y032_0333g2795 [Ancylostoma ceylanicum]
MGYPIFAKFHVILRSTVHSAPAIDAEADVMVQNGCETRVQPSSNRKFSASKMFRNTFCTKLQYDPRGLRTITTHALSVRLFRLFHLGKES